MRETERQTVIYWGSPAYLKMSFVANCWPKKKKKKEGEGGGGEEGNVQHTCVLWCMTLWVTLSAFSMYRKTLPWVTSPSPVWDTTQFSVLTLPEVTAHSTNSYFEVHLQWVTDYLCTGTHFKEVTTHNTKLQTQYHSQWNDNILFVQWYNLSLLTVTFIEMVLMGSYLQQVFSVHANGWIGNKDKCYDKHKTQW